MVSSLLNEETYEICPSSTTIKEATLHYFSLHNEGCETMSTSKTVHKYTKRASNDHHTQHGSPSAKRQWHPLLHAGESGAPLSWLSTLFSRRKKKHIATSGHACDESKCEPFSAATLDWEAPRASSWEQLSSWEKPSSSTWNLLSAEPHRASDADMQQLHPPISVRAAPAHDPLMKKKESPTKGQLKWVKSLAIKLRRRMRKKRVAEHGRGDGEEDDRESAMSAASSSGRGSEISQNALQNGQITGGQERVFHSQRELGATWSSHYSPLLQSYSNSKSRRFYHMRGDNGLLRFYLTPTRGIKIGSKRPRTHHPLIPAI